jgi:hypothetical protein
MADVLKYTKGAKSAEAAATAFKIGEGRMPDTNEAIQIGNAFNPLKDSNTARWSENVSKNIGGDNLSNFVNTKMGYVGKAMGLASDAVKILADGTNQIFKSQMGVQDANPAMSKVLEIVKTGGLNPLELMSSFVKGAFTEILDQLSQESALLSDVNRQTGISGKLSEALRDDMKEASIEGARFGFKLKDIGDFYIGLTSQSGKFSLINKSLTDETIKVAGALGRTLPEMAVSIGEFEKVGLGADKTIKTLGDSATKLTSLGLSARKVTTDLQSNLGKLNEYGFKNGVQGLETMAKKASEFRMEMQSTFTIADKVFNPEGAIDLVANLQVLGGAIGDFNDPLKLMYDATNNVEGLQDALIKASGSLATYNQEQGRFEVTGINLRKAKEMANALGISMGELNKISIAAAERTQATTALMATGLVMKDEDREFLTNLSRMDGGEMKITVPKSLMDSLGIKETSLALKDLTPNQEKILLANKEEFEKMNPKDMAMAQLTETQQMSRGIDVIASYYKVRGAEMARGIAKGTGGKEFEEFRASIDNYSVSLSKSQKSTIEKDAENFGGKVRTFFGNPIKGIGDMVSGKKQPDPTPPPSQKSEVTVKHQLIGMQEMTNFNREIMKNPSSFNLFDFKNPKEYGSPNVAVK